MTKVQQLFAGIMLPIMLITGALAITAPPADAFTAGEPAANLTATGDEFSATATEDTIFETVGKLVNIVLGILGIILFLYILWAGFIWMTAAGDTGKVEKAQKMMIQATIGIIIILSAYAISFFAVDQLVEATTSS